MQIAIKEFFDAFPGYEVSIRPRPDGMLLLTLGKQGETTMSKAIQSDAVFCKERVRGLIRDEAVRESEPLGLSVEETAPQG